MTRPVRIPVGEDATPMNAWDSFRLANHDKPDPRYGRCPGILTHPQQRLFGNHNIGIRDLSNLQVPGMVAIDRSAWIEHVYARHDLDLAVVSPRLRAALHMWTSRTIVTLELGDCRNVVSWSLQDLLCQEPWEPASVTEAKLPENLRADFRKRVLARREEGVYPIHVPPNRNVSVLIESAPKERLLDAIDTLTPTFWIHLEGYRQMAPR